MAKKITQEIVSAYLSETSPDKYFYLKDGRVLKNIEDLYASLNKMDEELFSFHRNNKKNDFYNWVKEVIGDAKLANELARAKTQKTTVKKVESRLKFLKQIMN